MGQVVWHPRAEADLEAVYDYIARASPHMAQAVVQRIRRATDRLRRFPLSGRLVPERTKGDVREIFVGSYRVMYRASDDEVLIVMVRHAARRLGGSELDG